jgi:osmotically-inducible protein OsmY
LPCKPEEVTVRAASETGNQRLQQAVQSHLEWDPAVDAGAVTADVDEGYVTLRGVVASYPAKIAAAKAARRVPGVRGVTNAIDVRVAVERTDEDLADNAALALRFHSTVPETVHAEVADGRVRLGGHVDWPFQKRSADRAVREIRGVRDVINQIVVAPRAAAHDVRHRIIRALEQNAELDARRVKVTVAHDRATLTGTVGSWLEREAAERAAANAPGIVSVDNRIAVEPPAWTVSDVDELC